MSTEILSDIGERFTLEGPASSHDTLATEALDAVLTKSLRNKIQSDDGIAVVIQVPSPDWVDPVTNAAKTLRRWGMVAPQEKTSRKRPDGANVANHLACGESVLGVSHAPERLLAAALVAAADLRLVVPSPDNAVIRRVVKRATRQSPRGLPPMAASGLDFNDIVSAIRVGSSARTCVERLASAARSMSVVDHTVAAAPPLEELHGYGAVQEWGRCLVSDLGEWREGRLDFAAIDRHVVLASAPGLGKSSFVRSLARSAKLPLVVTSVASWFSSTDGYLNSVIKEVDRVFASAAAMAPAIVFLDEMDALPDRRNLESRNRDYWLPIITQILLILDSATSGVSSKLCVIGATNHADRIDPALVRPGRLNRILQIAPPDAAAIEGILRQHLGADLAEADLRPVAAAAGGASGAQVQGWVKEARARARVAGGELTADHLLDVVAPADIFAPETRRRVAFHEAAHAVCAELAWPGSVKSVSVIARGDVMGSVSIAIPSKVSMTKADLEADAVFTLAGRAGEIVCCGGPSTGSGGSRDSDLGRATRIVASMAASFGMADRLTFMAPPDQALAEAQFDASMRGWIEAELSRLGAVALQVVKENRQLVEVIAHALCSRRHLDRAQFAALFERAGGRATPPEAAADAVDASSALPTPRTPGTRLQ